MFISPDQANALDQGSVRMATLGEFHFRAGTFYLWNGEGVLNAFSQEWRGLSYGGSLGDIPSMRGTDADVVRAQLSGTDASLGAIAKRSRDDVRGRPAYVWTGLFDQHWQPLGDKIPLWWGIMHRINIERVPGDEESGGSIILGLEIESVFSSRARTGASRYTDADQIFRHPGDEFCRFVAGLSRQTLTWPDY